MNWPPPVQAENVTLSDKDEQKSQCPLANPVMEGSEANLAELYDQALKNMQKAETLPRGDARASLYREAKKDFEIAMNLVENLSLFSDNETLEDVATSSLRYMLIPAYLVKIEISSECNYNTFKRAESMAKIFLSRIIKYGAGDEAMEKSLKDDVDLKGGLDTINLESAMRSRTEKIENFKRMKLLENQIVELEKRLKSNIEVDDEISREYYLNLLKKWTTDTHESLLREIRPALFFEKNRSQQGQSQLQSNNQITPTPKTFTIVKDSLQKHVFGLGYPSRPTVTVDEFIQKKMDDGELSFQKHKEVYGNSLQRYAEKPDLRREQEELSDAEHDDKEDRDDQEELKKKRQWDEFKDENPRGSGNRHNMG